MEPVHSFEKLRERDPDIWDRGSCLSDSYVCLKYDEETEVSLVKTVSYVDNHTYYSVDSPWGCGEDMDPSSLQSARAFYQSEVQRIKANLQDHDTGWDKNAFIPSEEALEALLN